MSKRTKAEQDELLNRPLEDFKDQRVVKDLMSEKFEKGTDTEALDITSALAELIRGQKFMSEEVTRMRERMDNYDEAARRFDEDQEAFIMNVLNKAEKLRYSDAEREKLEAKAIVDLEKRIEQAHAEVYSSRLKFEQDLANMPKETITATGVPEIMARTGQMILMPERIRIKHKEWVLQPNVPTTVPRIVADRYREIIMRREELRERQQAMMANLKDTELSKVLQRINEKYKAGGAALPIGSTA